MTTAANLIDVDFKIARNGITGAIATRIDRIDVRKVKNYALRIRVSGEVVCEGNWQLLNKLAAMTKRHAAKRAEAQSIGVYSFLADAWNERVTMTCTIHAEKPSAILLGHEQEVTDCVQKCAVMLEESFADAVREHTETVEAEERAQKATRIAMWAAKTAAEKAEKDIKFEERIAALYAEREAAIKVRVADTAWIVDAAMHAKDETFAPEVIEAALAALPRFIEAKIDAQAHTFSLGGDPEPVKPEDVKKP